MLKDRDIWQNFFGRRNCGTMLKDWVAGGNCASWPPKKGGKRAATKIP